MKSLGMTWRRGRSHLEACAAGSAIARWQKVPPFIMIESPHLNNVNLYKSFSGEFSIFIRKNWLLWSGPIFDCTRKFLQLCCLGARLQTTIDQESIIVKNCHERGRFRNSYARMGWWSKWVKFYQVLKSWTRIWIILPSIDLLSCVYSDDTSFITIWASNAENSSRFSK